MKSTYRPKNLRSLTRFAVFSATLAHNISFAQAAQPVYSIERDDSGIAVYPLRAVLRNGPIAADAKTVRVELDLVDLREVATEERTALPRVIERKPEFYIEAREFRDPRVIATVDYANGTQKDAVEVEIEASRSEANLFIFSIPTKGFVEQASFKFKGTQDVYKCFDPSTCVFSYASERYVEINQFSLEQVLKYRPILSAANSGIVISKRISDPTKFNITLNDEFLRRQVGTEKLFSGFGQAAPSGSEFVGLFASLAKFGTAEDLFTAYVFPSNGGLLVKTERRPYFSCNFSRVISYPEETSVAMPLGASCSVRPDIGDRWIYNDATPGENDFLVREAFFPDLKILE
jgi:hypothetical protein